MKRCLQAVLFFAILSAWVGAQGPTLRPSPADQGKMILRNRALYRTAIDHGLNLTGQVDALERAGTCTAMAKEWASEIEKAALNRDKDRVNELGKQLSQVVDQGVVPNLQEARINIKSGSLYEKTLQKRRDDAVDVLKPLIDHVLRSEKDYEPVRKSMSEGLDKVQNAAKN